MWFYHVLVGKNSFEQIILSFFLSNTHQQRALVCNVLLKHAVEKEIIAFIYF